MRNENRRPTNVSAEGSDRINESRNARGKERATEVKDSAPGLVSGTDGEGGKGDGEN